MHHRRDELDGLRAVAVLLVIVFHASNQQFVGGWIGVDIFFVLSGFLITGILTTEFERSGTISFGTFYLKRILRLAPALIVLLAVSLLAGLLLGSRDRWSDHIGAILASLFYVMNWVRAFQLPYEGHVSHVWSLAIEEQFYIVWPAILWLSLRLGGRRTAVIVAISLIASIVTWRIYLVAQGAPFNRTYNGFDTRADALFIGCLLGLGIALPYQLRRLWFVPVFVLAAISICARLEAPWVNIIGFDIIAACAAWIILALNESSPFKSLLMTKPMVFLGTISYGMYLWHAFFTSVMLGKGVKTEYVLLAILPLTIGFASASYYLLEKPFLNLKDKLGSDRSGLPAQLLPG